MNYCVNILKKVAKTDNFININDLYLFLSDILLHTHTPQRYTRV